MAPSWHRCAARWRRTARLRRRGTQPRPRRASRSAARWRRGEAPGRPGLEKWERHGDFSLNILSNPYRGIKGISHIYIYTHINMYVCR